jgi:prophage maintenance system killer protein
LLSDENVFDVIQNLINKRLFLRLNGYQISPDTEEAYEFLLAVASAKKSEADVESWIARHLERSRGE